MEATKATRWSLKRAALWGAICGGLGILAQLLLTGDPPALASTSANVWWAMLAKYVGGGLAVVGLLFGLIAFVRNRLRGV